VAVDAAKMILGPEHDGLLSNEGYKILSVQKDKNLGGIKKKGPFEPMR
jgi:hypothetical protein